MNYMWSVTLDDIIEAQELAKKRGKKEGESYEEEFLFIMHLKNIKPIAKSDMTKEELLNDFTKRKLKVLDLTKFINDYNRKKKDNEGIQE